MATIIYTATAKDSLLLQLPKEAQSLNIQPGDKIEVGVHIADAETEQKSVTAETQEQITSSLAERFAGRVGRFRFDSDDLSERTGQAYAELLAQEYEEGQQ